MRDRVGRTNMPFLQSKLTTAACEKPASSSFMEAVHRKGPSQGPAHLQLLGGAQSKGEQQLRRPFKVRVTIHLALY